MRTFRTPGPDDTVWVAPELLSKHRKFVGVYKSTLVLLIGESDPNNALELLRLSEMQFHPLGWFRIGFPVSSLRNP
jgi:hypothetical protein